MKLLKYLGASAVVLLLVGSLTENVLLYKQVKTLKSDPAYMASKETDTVIAAVGRLMVLPDETPTIATVDDPDKLKGQPFFENAKKGDKVLIFSKAKRAVLYDPVADKIVESAPLTGTEAPPAPAAGDVNAPPSSDAGTAPVPAPAVRKTHTN